MVNHSRQIQRLVRALRVAGYDVDLHAHDLDVAGRVCRDTRMIWINESNAKAALITLVHEAGHVVDYARGSHACQWRRERAAYLCGWGVIRTLGLDITRAEWREDGLANLALYTPS